MLTNRIAQASLEPELTEKSRFGNRMALEDVVKVQRFTRGDSEFFRVREVEKTPGAL